jgi:AraC family transcriptional regulator
MPGGTWHIGHINRVIDHIDTHLAGELDLDTLAAVAHVSRWHFHRVFHALTGETLAERVRRRRLEVAAGRLVASPERSALAVALDVGFGSAEVFSRAFRAHFGVTPTAWRRGAYRDWARQHKIALGKIHQADRKASQEAAFAFLHDGDLWPAGRHEPPPGGKKMDVEIKTLPETRVAYMRHVGAYGSSSITSMWQRFAVWSEARGLMRPRRRMFGISQDSPEITAPDKCRYDACVEVDAAFVPEGEIGVQAIWGGRYACARFVGTPADIHGAWMRFLSEWLPGSRYQCGNHPALELYEPDFTVDPHTGAFACWLCMPVVPAT